MLEDSAQANTQTTLSHPGDQWCQKSPSLFVNFSQLKGKTGAAIVLSWLTLSGSFMGHFCVVWNVLLWGVVGVIHSTTDSLVQRPQLLPLAVYALDPNCSGSFSPWAALSGRSHHDGLNMHPCVHGEHPHLCHPNGTACFNLLFSSHLLRLMALSSLLLSVITSW